MFLGGKKGFRVSGGWIHNSQNVLVPFPCFGQWANSVDDDLVEGLLRHLHGLELVLENDLAWFTHSLTTVTRINH